MIEAWHFCRKNMKLGYDDNRLIVAGEILKVDCEPVLCKSGLHGSINILDALKYAPGPIICRTIHSGKIITGNDKLTSTERKCLWYIDGESLLKEFARRCALDVIHLWDAPNVVREYLETGDEAIRAPHAAACAAAYAADATADAANAAYAAHAAVAHAATAAADDAAAYAADAATAAADDAAANAADAAYAANAAAADAAAAAAAAATAAAAVATAAAAVADHAAQGSQEKRLLEMIKLSPDYKQ